MTRNKDGLDGIRRDPWPTTPMIRGYEIHAKEDGTWGVIEIILDRKAGDRLTPVPGVFATDQAARDWIQAKFDEGKSNA